MRLGIDRLLADGNLRRPLAGRRVAMLGHPASVNHVGRHSLDALMSLSGLRITAAFGPQHGMRGDKQDNMIESDDYVDPFHQIPVFSLYGQVRYPTDAMLDQFDVLLVDLQDIGTRIYTYVTTLAYVLDACAKRARPSGCSTAPTRSVARRRQPARGRLAELRRRRAAADAPWAQLRRAGALADRQQAARSRVRGDPHGRLRPRDAPPAGAGRATSWPGSTRARTPPASTWRVVSPVLCCSKAPPCPKGVARPCR